MDGATSETQPASSTNGLKKVFTRTNRSKATLNEVDSSTSSRSAAPSIESNHEPPQPSTSGGGGGVEESYNGPPTGISKLIPGSRRRRKKKMEMENSISQSNGSGTELHSILNEPQDAPSFISNRNRSSSTVDATDRGTSNLSESAKHSSIDLGIPRLSRQSSSSPLIVTTSATSDTVEPISASNKPSETASENGRYMIRASTTGDMGDSRSSSAERKSRNLKGAFSPIPTRNSRSPSPEPEALKSPVAKSGRGLFTSRSRSSTSAKKNPMSSEEVPPLPSPLPQLVGSSATSPTPPNAQYVTNAPTSPPGTDIPAPVTTVTPPTPVGLRSQSPALPSANVAEDTDSAFNSNKLPPNTVVSPSGNMISHRRVRSASSAHNPSKLSNSMTAPLTPTAEESKTASGFFSSMFSAAQNAASNFGNSLNSQVRTLPTLEAVEPEKSKNGDPRTEAAADSSRGEETAEIKELAVETLGQGELNFSHLGIDASADGVITTNDGVVFTKTEAADRPRRGTASQRDEISARIEDMRAARAVSMAYETPADGASASQQVPVPEQTGTDTRPSAPLNGLGRASNGEQTPPGGSIFEGETGASVKRSGSVRSRLARRHRGSSGATIGALGAAGLGLGVPGANSSVPRLTGFAVASKKRNRDFHQLFRSVPEDDYLIEDYSCALQREIILAGRIYISEGHICFSSNILGWVTTLVISFDEIIAIEKESTAVVFPNAIAIQTLHARHTFRSLLSREATYDLMVNIWKINHPTLKSSVNGTRIEQGTGDKTEKAYESDPASEGLSDEEDEIYDEDEEDEGTHFMDAVDASIASSDKSESIKRISRKASTMPLAGSSSTPQVTSKNEVRVADKGAPASATSSLPQFPGPAAHAPTEFTDPSGRYDKLIKDEIIPAPLGFVYTLVFGPASGAFMSKFLVEYQKVTDLQLEDDKKGLSTDNKTRSYSYIKPLNAPIGPKQTKCISTENLDMLDLEKAVLVTLTTQTPDVPSGNIFSVKTKYLLTWAENSATRLYMTCTIEWSGKSWLKGPIEKGANDGQVSFGNDLVKALRVGVAPRSRAANLPKGAGKGLKGKRKGAGTTELEGEVGAQAPSESEKPKAENWGILEPLRGPLGPIVSIFKPFWSGNVAAGVIAIVLVMVWFRSPPPSRLGSSGVGSPLLSIPERMIAYEELWQREESELWNWLEDRVGMDGLAYPVANPIQSYDESDRAGNSRTERQRQKQQHKSEEVLEGRLRHEKMTEREMEDAIRITQQRLNMLKVVMKRKPKDE
ncbi:hypothetical protein AJ78_07838 [Emergomyces pasteurianus Ep9510]|uniref:VASt domain-containing protein n=1 Tax=Emergomyces pasteurianus Ep9510 TaxID=1447872 RepID=A0A1J9PU43_9EURO|nr:hypothetical protein AJ78_07838 [Emergomyces pasteurianus Ep9510]